MSIELEIKYEGFGGGPLVGGGPGARAPWAPLKSGPVLNECFEWADWYIHSHCIEFGKANNCTHYPWCFLVAWLLNNIRWSGILVFIWFAEELLNFGIMPIRRVCYSACNCMLIYGSGVDELALLTWLLSATVVSMQNVHHRPKRTLAFSDIFPNGYEFLVLSLHAYWTFISMLEYKFLFNYLQLWRSYAILSATTQRAFRSMVDIHIMVVALNMV